MPRPISARSGRTAAPARSPRGARPAERRARGICAPARATGALVTDASAIRGDPRRRWAAARPAPLPRARDPRRVHRLCEKRVPAHLLLVVDEVRDVHVRCAPPSAWAGTGGGAAAWAPPSARPALDVVPIPPNPAPIAAAAPGAPYRWLAIADIAVGLEKSARGFAAAGKPRDVAGTAPDGALKFSVRASRLSRRPRRRPRHPSFPARACAWRDPTARRRRRARRG